MLLQKVFDLGQVLHIVSVHTNIYNRKSLDMTNKYHFDENTILTKTSSWHKKKLRQLETNGKAWNIKEKIIRMWK
jgi:hypothetical protein